MITLKEAEVEVNTDTEVISTMMTDIVAFHKVHMVALEDIQPILHPIFMVRPPLVVRRVILTASLFPELRHAIPMVNLFQEVLRGDLMAHLLLGVPFPLEVCLFPGADLVLGVILVLLAHQALRVVDHMVRLELRVEVHLVVIMMDTIGPQGAHRREDRREDHQPPHHNNGDIVSVSFCAS